MTTNLFQPRGDRSRSSKGTVTVRNYRGRLQLYFRVNKKRYYISLNLDDTKPARRIAEARAKIIELDIISGHFDASLTKYKPNQPTLSIELPTPSEQLDIIWTKYTNHKQSRLSPSTLARDYTRYQSHINKLPTKDLGKALMIRDYLVGNTTPNTAKRCLVNFSAACDWAMDSGMIDTNPFSGMAAKIDLPKSEKSEFGDIDPFSAEERDAIIQAFKDDRYYSHYAPITWILFHTGARPSEIVSLQWKAIARDYRFITFDTAVIRGLSGLIRKDGLKTQARRKFPCNEPMKAFLKEHKANSLTTQPGDLIFAAPRGGFIDINNFRNRGWTRILGQLGLDYRKLYQTRHTFCTLALENGLDAKDVARLVGNSAEVIYRHYASSNINKLEIPVF